ncbi:methyl-accepting chemotaxis protein [Motilimonas cestriensis]|uniref:methyl-accepting chemotaxis protein n=1 Tax=Motilimonas cestriensis TaxID=2742685 RepID=UPI003DA5B14E
MNRLLANLTIRTKLILVVLLPLLGLTYFGVNYVSEAYFNKQQAESLSQLTILARVSSEWVHELQKERGMSAGYLGSKGSKFKDQLPEQRLLVDTKRQAFKAHIEKVHFAPELAALNQDILTQAQRLATIRNQVSQLQISVADEVAYYTQLNKKLLSAIDTVANQSTEASLAIDAVAIGAFLQHKERAGIERAVLSNTFAADHFLPGFYERFIRLIAEQDAYLDRFIAHRPDLISYMQQQLQSPEIKKVNELRQLAIGKAQQGGFNQDPEAWFAAITKKINILKKIENMLIDTLEKESAAQISQQTQAFWLSLAIALPCLIISIMFSFFLAKQLTQSITISVNTIDSIINNKNFSTRIPITGKDEINVIAKLINHLLANIEQLLTEIKTSTETLTDASIENEKLTKNMLHQINGGMTQIDLVATAMNEMNATVHDIAHNAVNASEQTEAATNQASHGDKEVDATVLAISALQEEMGLVMKVVKELDKSANEIGQFLDVIKNISEQTNLLALNAAIEAARAGESGRGFAVVADEVRSLSTQTRNSTLQIETMTKTLKSGASEAVETMNRGMEQVEASVTEAKRAGQDISEIVNNIKAISLMNIQVATAAEEQSSVTEEINRNVSDMQGNFQQIDHSSQQLNQVNNNLTALAKQLDTVLSEYNLGRVG